MTELDDAIAAFKAEHGRAPKFGELRDWPGINGIPITVDAPPFAVGEKVTIPPGTTTHTIVKLWQEDFPIGGRQWVARFIDGSSSRVAHLREANS